MSTAPRWILATAEKPCPVCERTDWCQVSADGCVAMCMRESAGAFKSKATASGAEAHFHRLAESLDRKESKPLTATPGTEIADIDTRHAVYTVMLAACELSPAHREDLVRRKAPDPMARGYRTLPKSRVQIVSRLRSQFDDETLLAVPGFVAKVSKKGERYLTISAMPGLLIPVRDEAARIIGVKVRVDDSAADKGGKYRWLSSRSCGGPSPSTPAHCPIGVKSPCVTLRLTEAPLKADVAGALNCIPTIGADAAGNWRPAVALAKRLGAQTVRLAFDADSATNPQVARAVVSCAAALQDAGITVEIETWPVEAGKGIDDVLAAGGAVECLTGEAAVEWLAALTGTAEQATVSGRTEIEITEDEFRVNDAVVATLARDETIYQRSGRLVIVVNGLDAADGINRDADAPRIVGLPLSTLRERMTRQVYFYSRSVNSEGVETIRREHPPRWCCEAILDRGHWRGIRPLMGIVTVPVLRRDGTILNSTGYDSATCLLFDPQGVEFTIPENPTRGDARRAVELLLDVVCDFPFEKPEHRAAWVAFLLTALARYAFDGPAPLFLIDANTRGSGKTLLAEIVSLIVTGRDFARMSNPRDDDEARKRILSIALAGDPLILIDNVAGQLGCASLDAALTATVWRDRILGKSEMVEMPLNLTWSATGNNVILAAETSRRCCHIRLQSPLENPELRDGFKRPNLSAWVRANRPALLSAALTVLRAFCVAGRPRQDIRPWGSFDGWSGLVRQALVWAGEPDPGETRQELVQNSDREASALRDLIGGWPEADPQGEGLTAAELVGLLDGESGSYKRLRSAILELCNAPAGKLPGARSVGNKLRHLRGRIIGGHAIDSRESRDKVQKWFLVNLSAGSAGSAGSVSAPLRDAGAHRRAHTRARTGGELDPADPADPAPAISNPPRGAQHKATGCDSRRWWEHVTGGVYCLDCCPPTDHRAIERKGVAP